MAQTHEFIEMFYDCDRAKRAIRLHVSPQTATVELFANTDGMAYLATLVSSILLYASNEEIAYLTGSEQGIVEGSPDIRFEFDPTLDDLQA